MTIDAAEIKRLIVEGLPDAEVKIEDLRGDGEHFVAYVISPSFEGKTRVQQHQAVYKILENHMGEKLHSLAIQTVVPE